MATPTFPDIDGFSVHVTIFVAPENVDKLLAAFKPVFELVSAEEECIFFEMYQDPASPGTLSWVENWYIEPRILIVLANRLQGTSPQSGSSR
jgi:hypothetical protein